MKVASISSHDIRFPTSRSLDGSDAMNPDPDYSAAYVVLQADDGSEGHGFTFTIGRGNEVCRAAIDALAPLIAGQSLDDLGELYRKVTHDSQMRWLGPEKGVMHLAAGAIVNAAWDWRAKQAGLPLWELLASLSPDEIVDQVDWRYLTDTLTPAGARDLLIDPARRSAQVATLKAEGYPAYTTSAGWLGYSDEKIERLAREAVDSGFRMIKLKVGADLDDDIRRFALARAVVGPDIRIAVDANQRWDVPDAVTWMAALAKYDPWWIEEPTSPDDILGHAVIRQAIDPIRVATGEHIANRVVFKQLLQADAIDFVQLDACRVAGVNENLAVLLLAAAYEKPVCPHAGGVGLCEAVRHLSFFDYAAVSGTFEDRAIEFVDHLHEHFVDPAIVAGGRYLAPAAPGFSTQMRAESLARYTYPEGSAWH